MCYSACFPSAATTSLPPRIPDLTAPSIYPPPDRRRLCADEVNASKRLRERLSRFASQSPRSHERSRTASCPLVFGPVFLDDADRLGDMVNSFAKGSTEVAELSLLSLLGRQLGPLSAWIAGVEAGDAVLSIRSNTGIARETDGAVGGAVLAREVGGMPPRLLEHEHCLGVVARRCGLAELLLGRREIGVEPDEGVERCWRRDDDLLGLVGGAVACFDDATTVFLSDARHSGRGPDASGIEPSDKSITEGLVAY